MPLSFMEMSVLGSWPRLDYWQPFGKSVMDGKYFLQKA